MMNNNERIAYLHQMGIKGIYLTIGKGKIFVRLQFILSALFTVLIVSLACRHQYVPDLLKALCKTVTDFFPEMLGFTLSAYAIIIGLGNVRVLQKLSRPSDAESPTLYQKLNGLFAACLLIQLLTFITSHAVLLLTEFCEKVKTMTLLFPVFFLCLVLLLTLWALLILITIVLMLFNIGQIQNWQLLSGHTEPPEH